MAISIWTFLFGLFGNMNNISVNTQGVYTEKLLTTMPLFTVCGVLPVWALIGLGMLKFQLTTHEHFLIVGAIVIAMVLFNYKF
jgi:hypothetical protein